LKHATIAANRRRIRRLLGALDDLAGYSGPLSEHRMLALAWSRLSDVLLLHAADLEGACRHRDAAVRPARDTTALRSLRQAVARVSTFQIGTHGWWLAVHDVADLGSRELACCPEPPGQRTPDGAKLQGRTSAPAV
jgi:hypothetical protein